MFLLVCIHANLEILLFHTKLQNLVVSYSAQNDSLVQNVIDELAQNDDCCSLRT